MAGVAGNIARAASMGASSGCREPQLRLTLDPEADGRPKELFITSATDVTTGRALPHRAKRVGRTTLPEHGRVTGYIRIPVQQDASAIPISQRPRRQRRLSGLAHGAGISEAPAPEWLD